MPIKSKPLLLVKVDFTKVVKKAKKTTKKKVVKKAVKPPAPPVRLSPFKLGDEVWRPKGNYANSDWVKGKILKCSEPKKEEPWTYSFTDGNEFDEGDLISQKVFHMIATDAIRLKTASFVDSLNNVFDGKASAFGVYRSGQKRPWAYYVFPGGWQETLCKYTTWTDSTYGGQETAHLWKTTAEECNVKLLPISSHPREILTYLGIHVYSRLWMKKETDGKEDT